MKGGKFKVNKRHIWITLGILLVLFFVYVFWRTGFLQLNNINERDTIAWEYDENGVIKNSEEFFIEGSKNVCWLLVHSYCSTPDEMRDLAEKINLEFNDYIYVPRLKGHAEFPEKILNLSLEDWYNQIEKDYDYLILECNKINVVGSSIGGTIVTRLAEEKELNNVYSTNAFLVVPYKFYYVLTPETYMHYLGRIIHYSKKRRLAQINDPEGLKEHVAYWNMPYVPMVNSEEFVFSVKEDLNKVTENILIQHSINDKTSSIESAEMIFDEVSSEDKLLIKFEKSNHVLLRDYDRNEVIKNIIEFEREHR